MISHTAGDLTVTGNTETTRPANNAYFPALDGLRAVAFLMVFGFHYLQLPWGWAGVDIFFVLSGFLITGILFDTRDDPHRVRNFYIRRTLRIFPLYYGIFLLILLLEPVFRWRWDWTWIAWPLYLGNWVRFLYPFIAPGKLDLLATASLASGNSPRIGLFLGHFWTLCVEEQFYLVWPWLVFSIRDRKRLIYVCLACVIICPVLRILVPAWLPQPVVATYVTCWFTPLRIDCLLLGGLIALIRRGPNARAMLYVARAGFVLFSVVILAWFILNPFYRPTLQNYPYPFWNNTWGLSFIDTYAAFLIVLCLEFRSIPFHIFNLRPLRWLGRISYGAYVFHDMFHPMYLRTARHLWYHWRAGTAAIGLLATLLLASASFRWFESPFIRLKKKWSS